MQKVFVFEPHPDDALSSAANILFSDKLSTTVVTVTDPHDDRSSFDFMSFDCPDIRKPLNISNHLKLDFKDLHWDYRDIYTENMTYASAASQYIQMYTPAEYQKLIKSICNILFKNYTALAAFPLGIRHPMHMLVMCAGIEAIRLTNFPVHNVCFYFDHPYTLLEHNSDKILNAKKYITEKLGDKTEGCVVYNDYAIDQSQLGKAIELAYGEVHFAEFAGTLAKTIQTDLLPGGSHNAFVSLLKLRRNDILMVCSQASPYFSTGGSGAAIYGLSSVLLKYVNSVSVLLPKRPELCSSLPETPGVIPTSALPDKQDIPVSFSEARFCKKFTSEYYNFDDEPQQIYVDKYEYNNITYYIADVVDYTKLTAGTTRECEASAIFCDAVLQTVLDVIDYKPSVLHCHDWQTGLIPFLKKVKYGNKNIPPCLFTVHAFAYKGICDKSIIYHLTGLDGDKCRACITCSYDHCHLRNISYLSWSDSEKLGIGNNYMSFMNAGIKYADRVTTTSKGYAAEISMYPDTCGVKINGIRNGIDNTNKQFPSSNGFLKPDDSNFIKAKAYNKERLRLLFKLPKNDSALVCIVSRLSPEKGFNQILYAIDDLAKRNIQLIICGDESTKEKTITNALNEAISKYPENIRFTSFDKELEYELYAASDIILIPSLNETCGTTQMISMNLGVVPVITMLSAFEDTVTGYHEREEMNKGIGFYFFRDNQWSMLEALDKALKVFETKYDWNKIVKKNIVTDFGWHNNSLKEYLDLYNSLL